MLNISDLIEAGVLKESVLKGDKVIILQTPCRFIFREEVVSNLQKSYLPNEEIGGLFWAKPRKEVGEGLFEITKVSYIRNAIEDKPRTDGLNRTNACLLDGDSLNSELALIFKEGFLPIKFHTHPIYSRERGLHFIEQLKQAETSKQDRIESKFSFIYDGQKILTPRALVIGSEVSSNDIIIGIYDGGVAPVEIKGSLERVQIKNLTLASESLCQIQLSEKEKLVFAIFIIIIIMAILKYPRAGLQVALLLGLVAPAFLSQTKHLDDVSYYAKLNAGQAKILLP